MNAATIAILKRVEAGLTTAKDADELRATIARLEKEPAELIERWRKAYVQVCRERDRALGIIETEPC